MWGGRVFIGMLAALTTASVAAGCGSYTGGGAGGEVVPDNAVVVQVRNENFLDMDVFAVNNGVATRLGTVTGNSGRNFVLPRAVTTTGVSIVATPIGGEGRATSGSLMVAPGETVEFRIGSILANSAVYIR